MTVLRPADPAAAAAAAAALARHPVEHHRDVQGGAARAAVFGISDGLLTNVSLILGVAAAHPAAGVVRLTGVAGLVAGALSMAAGEYISMSAQSELVQRELEIERRELERHPEQETRELAESYRRRGVPAGVADMVAASIMADPNVALEVHAREELGVNPSQTGSPLQAAGSSFVSFCIGALIPLLPWFFASGTLAVWCSVGLGVIAALAVGWSVAFFTGRSRVRGAVRQLLIACASAAVTWGIGALVGGHTPTV